PKTTQGDAKPESQWTPDERRVVVQDQLLKSIIMSCLPDDIIESIISCVSTKETWADLVHSFEGPSDTKENRIMDLKLEYQTFKAKSTKSLSRTYTRYKTLLNELANDDVNLLDIEYHERSLLANSKRHFIRDCFSKMSEPSYKSPVNNYSSVSKGFQPKFTLKLIQSSFNSNNQADPKFQKDYKAEYKKMKAKLAGNGYQQKGQKRSQNGQNRAHNGKSAKSQSQSQQKVKVIVNQKVNPDKIKSHSQRQSRTEEILNGPTRTDLMGRVSSLSIEV
ncbi:hypothetical protein Tco_0070349, partial [Tanacetum coccineum]